MKKMTTRTRTLTKMPTMMLAVVAMLAAAGVARAAAKSVKVPMTFITTEGVGKSAGTITLKEGKDGVMLEPKLKGLPPGEHGLHLSHRGLADVRELPGDHRGGVREVARPAEVREHDVGPRSVLVLVLDEHDPGRWGPRGRRADRAGEQ